MEVIIFESLSWDEIPKQDNPRYDASLQEPCLVICESEKGYEVRLIHAFAITKDCILGTFEDIYYASLFADALANENS